MNIPDGVRFQVISTRTVEPKNKRKFVAYKVIVLKGHDEDDPNPATFERRYNEFLALYNGLRQEFPNHFSGVQFPRKALIGNFKPDMISARSASFETLLSIISSESQLRRSRPVVSFLQDKELREVLALVKREEYGLASPVVENSFRLMNKVDTDRSPWVLRWLCLHVCVAWANGDQRAGGLAGLALRRYQAVSDADLLRYYVPLLQLAEDICQASGIDTRAIKEQLDRLKATGVSVSRGQNLLTLLLNDLSEHAGSQSIL